MSRWEAWIEEVSKDDGISAENRLRIIASLKDIEASQAKQRALESVPMDQEAVVLLTRAARYLVLAERLHSTEPRAMLAVLLAVCDLQR